MNPAALKLAVAGVLALLLLAVGGTWKVQDWRYSALYKKGPALDFSEQGFLRFAD
ncbi:hypothetical protein [Pseudomonas frederiksbergensis]|uniref:hypothetical protein n=1 Tax=Pseudomonas frederiksbergensis TaxID=104087 RepID=UPI0018DBA947|nr:hypothetical protein [Pseudomonas frederiksbergensis]